MASRGTATVMFTDLVDSTGTWKRLGDAAADALRRRHDELLRRAVGEHAGTLVKGLGDGVMATFVAASDAVAAGIAVQQAIDIHNRRFSDERLSVRIGLSAGDVQYDGLDCFGGPVIEASRLCTAAAGGQILAADVVRLLARSVTADAFRSLDPVQVRGMDSAVPVSEVAWQPVGSMPALFGQPALPTLLRSSRQLGFAGRDHELDATKLIWERALTGDRQALLLSGEPGIGKTRLAGELAVLAHNQGATVLYGRCEEDLGAPDQPIAEALDYLTSALPAEELTGSLGRYPEELARLVPALAMLLADLPAPLRSDAETERYRLFEAVASCLASAAGPRGLVLVIDDLHWATRPTLVLLQHVLHATSEAKLLVVGTYRDTDLTRTHPLGGVLADLRRSPGVTRLALGGLDLDGVIKLVSEAAGHQLDAAGQSLAVAVHAETEGNPFFVGEVLRHLRESGAIYQQDGRWVSDRTTAQLGIPEGVRDVIGRRLNRLSTQANAALSVAAVIGRDFPLDLVARVGGQSEETVVAGLEEACAARLVEETAVASYRFAHALVRSTLYDELSATRRARMHATVAAQLEQTHADDVVALAHHYSAAGVAGSISQAVEYNQRAGDQAMNQLAHDSAVTFYLQALELLAGLAAVDEPRRCNLLIALGSAQRRCGDDTYRGTLLDAADLARRAGTPEQLTRAALANGRGFWSMAGRVDQERINVLQYALDQHGTAATADRARLLARLASELMFSHDRTRRETLAEESIAVARRAGDPLALAEVLAELGPSTYTPWMIDRGVVWMAELRVLAAGLEHPYLLAFGHLWTFVNTYLSASDQQLATDSLDSAEQLAADLGQPTLRWLTSVWRAALTQMQGNTEHALALAEQAFRIGQEVGEPDAWTWYAGQFTTIAHELGQDPELIETIEREVANQPGLPAWQVVLCATLCDVGRHGESKAVLHSLVDVPTATIRLPQDVLWIFGIARLLLVASDLQETDSVELLYRQLLPFRHLSVNGGVSYHGSAEHSLGIGAAALSWYDEAITHLDAAIADEERLGARLFLGLSYAELANVLLQRDSPGDHDRAVSATASARALADETGGVLILTRLPSERSRHHHVPGF